MMVGIRSVLQFARLHRALLIKKNMRTVGMPNYSQRVYKKTVFQPAFGKDEQASAREEVIIDDRKTLDDAHEEVKAEKKKIRKLNAIDKYILVRLGKYKSVKDVPDKLVYSDTAKKEAATAVTRNELLGSVFRYAYIFEYSSLILTLAIFALVYNWYKKYGVEKSEESQETAAESQSS